ncbi:hypothetical protein [Flagellimonas algicola]|uniref:PepSY-like beta-lactamase-inhibitor n=1 Tax=Flagellimonas algicola TaxID=2583815 RepID=A0ABY2WJG3_9FLAO|nr:hypothetical protein [Allomuricauda algicola]TMU54682.1 hypothetical protein FGG15_10785 [Allomuricauda algicola]
MKNVLMGLLFIGMTSMGYSQYDPMNGNIENDSFDFLFANLDYLDGVQGKTTPDQVRFLEGIVADWDVSKVSQFDGRSELFRVVFKSNKGQINVAFDGEGKIKLATEKFKNVKMPAHIQQMIKEKYPQWKPIENLYLVTYRNGRKTTKTLKVKLEKGNNTKHLKVTDSGLLL